MTSPLFNAFGGRQQIPKANGMTRPINMMRAFIDFWRDFGGDDQKAKQKIESMVSSGQLSQEALEKAKGMANQMQQLMGMFMQHKS